MKKVTSLLLSAAVIGGIALTSFAPAAYADDRPGFGQRGERMGQMGDHDRREGGPGRGGFIRLMCSEDGAARLELMLNHMDDRITLTDEQKALYDTFKTQALAAQTQYADSCTQPTRGPGTDIVDRLKTGQENMKALVSAMDTVIPAFEAFHDSLTDAQKAEMQPQRGQGRWGDRDGDRDGRRQGMRHGMEGRG